MITKIFKGEFMIEKIAMWGGFAGVIVAIIAIVVLFLTRENILDILDKDVILFDKNFELKKQAIERAMLLVDELSEKGDQEKGNYEFAEKAKRTYNELLCVVSDARVADEFYNLAVDNSTAVSATKIANFKLLCRADIGLSNKKARLLKKVKSSNEKNNEVDIPSFGSSEVSRPAYTQTISRPMPQNTPVQPRPTRPAMPTRPMPTRPAPRPTRPMPKDGEQK